MEIIGKILFLISLIFSFFASYYYQHVDLTTFLFFLGIIIGLLNISKEERHSFLISASALLLIGIVSFNFAHMSKLFSILVANLLVMISGAVLVVALKQIIFLAKD